MKKTISENPVVVSDVVRVKDNIEVTMIDSTDSNKVLFFTLILTLAEAKTLYQRLGDLIPKGT